MCKSAGDVADYDLRSEWVSKEVGVKWVEIMREGGLFGDAKRGCHVLATRVGKRKEWGEILGRVIAAEK